MVCRGGIVIDVYWCSGPNYHWASESCSYGGESSQKANMKENIWNTKWKGAIVRHLEALKLHRGSSPAAISQVHVDKANSISVKIGLFFVCLYLSLCLCLPFPLILFLPLLSHIKVIPFYVFLQQLNQRRQCAKVNKCITHPQISSATLWAKTKTQLFYLNVTGSNIRVLFRCCLNPWKAFIVVAHFLFIFFHMWKGSFSCGLYTVLCEPNKGASVKLMGWKKKIDK